MNLEHLGYMLEIQRCKSINRASKALFISQSNLSTVLKSVENELGYSIFERTNTGIRPTSRGVQFLSSAEIIYNEYARLKLAEDPIPADDTLAISAAFSSFFSKCFFEFLNEHPSVSDNPDTYHEGILEESLQELMNHQVRMVISYMSELDVNRYGNYAKRHGLAFYPQPKRVRLYAVVGKDHPLAERTQISAKELLNYPLVSYDTATYEDMLEPLRIQKKANVLYVSCRATFYDAIRYGKFCATSISFTGLGAEGKGYVCVPIAAPPLVIAFFWHSGYQLNQREKLWYTHMINQINKLPSKTSDNGAFA